ncbi:MAG: hypothetical protein ACRC14_04790 [Paracoccaceae bacterium]
MARKPKTDGEEIRAITSGPDIEHDALIGQIEARNREDHSRASSAGESRQHIGEFLEQSNMNSQAFSWCRTILKKPDEAKQMDIIRSLETALPMIKAHVTGQGTADLFNAPAAPSYSADADFEDAPEPVDVDDLPADERREDVTGDGDEFDKHLAEVYPA